MTLYFGVDVDQQLIDWILSEFADELGRKYGRLDLAGNHVCPDFGVTIEKDDPSWPFNYAYGNSASSEEEEGFFDNIEGKLRFHRRTGLPSSEARTRPDLIEPGDFPYAGAGTYRGYTGGVSAFSEEADWWVFCRIVDKYIELRAVVATAAIQVSRSTPRPVGMKYLQGIDLAPAPSTTSRPEGTVIPTLGGPGYTTPSAGN